MNWKYIIIGIGVFVIAGAGYVITGNVFEGRVPVNEPDESDQEVLMSVETQGDGKEEQEEIDTEDWIVHSSNELGFSILLPQEFEESESHEEGIMTYDVHTNFEDLTMHLEIASFKIDSAAYQILQNGVLGARNAQEGAKIGNSSEKIKNVDIDGCSGVEFVVSTLEGPVLLMDCLRGGNQRVRVALSMSGYNFITQSKMYEKAISTFDFVD